MTSTNTVLQAKDLHIFYGAIHAVKGVSFVVNKGQVVSLIGANGAGKSSILRGISGVATTKGHVELRGIDITSMKPHVRVEQGLAQSPEGRGVFPNLTVTENLEMGGFILKNKSDLNQGIEQAFSLFPKLKDRKDQLAGTMSGGEQQMLAIGRALMSKPEVLLLDEPSLGLAPLIVNQIFEIILKLNSQGMSILLVEQNAKMALKVSHQAYVLETGLITLAGPGKELLHNPEVQRSYLGI